MKLQLSAITAAIAFVTLTTSVGIAAPISAVEAQPAGTTGLSIGQVEDPQVIVTAILSQPGTFNGRTYTSWAFLANDGTGSLTVFGTMPGGYSPPSATRLPPRAPILPFTRSRNLPASLPSRQTPPETLCPQLASRPSPS